jgi:chromosome segregation ATPase
MLLSTVGEVLMKRLANLAVIGGIVFFIQIGRAPLVHAGQSAPTKIEAYEDEEEDLGQLLDTARDTLGMDIALRDRATPDDRKKLDDEIATLKNTEIPKLDSKLEKVREQLSEAQSTTGLGSG